MENFIERAGGLSLRGLLPECQMLGAADIRAASCCSDSRHVRPGDLFVALPGVESDGHDHVVEARDRGAAAFLVERPVPVGPVPSCIVPDVREAYGLVCHTLAGDPSRSLRVVGITGTNGKSTTTALVRGVFRAAGACVGSIGTLGIFNGWEQRPASHTTPPAHVLAQSLAEMASNGLSHAVMEVSSHALSQARVAGIEFDAACFTNLRSDHLDYHGSIVNYHAAKARLIERLSPEGLLVLNVDDPGCAKLAARACGPVVTFGMLADAELTATVAERDPSEQVFLLSVGNETAAVQTPMIGDHHVYNCLAAAAVGVGYGIDLQTIVRGLESVVQVPGRMERIVCGQPFGVFVDYAHTPDALASSLTALRQITAGRLICVFGAGGNRDVRKRPLMGAAVERGADLAVVTSDNPRDEDPREIAYEIRRGFNRPSQAKEILDRGEAVAWALAQARPGDSVLIAGKGHETYQQIGRHRYPFDDREVVRGMLYEMAAEAVAL